MLQRYDGCRGSTGNGTALNTLHDKAFDLGLITFDEDLRLVCGSSLRDHYANETVSRSFKGFEGKPLALPVEAAGPKEEYLEWHRENVFGRWGKVFVTSLMPKLYEYFGLIFLFYSDDHDPMHLHVQSGDREGIIMLIIVNGELVEVRWRAKRGADMLNEKEQREAELFVRAMKDDIVQKWTDFYVEHKRIKPQRITRRIR